MTGKSGTTPSMIDLYDQAALAATTPQPCGGIRLPDGRALSWAEYGSPGGVPCLLLPETGSSRLAPHWLLHDTTVPAAVRLLALDRPGIGASDPIGFGGREDPAEDLRHLVDTLAVGRIAVIGIGQGASDALTFAARYPGLVTQVLAISPRMTAEPPSRHRRWRPPSWSTATVPAGPVAAWLRAAGHGADLTTEHTWQRASRRIDPRSARILGQRWQDPDFRQAFADDLGQAPGTWTAPTVAPPPDWEHTTCPVPVQIWHGRDETGTTLAHARAVAHLHDWHITAVDGCSAMFAAWPQILAAATDSFHPAAA